MSQKSDNVPLAMQSIWPIDSGLSEEDEEEDL